MHYPDCVVPTKWGMYLLCGWVWAWGGPELAADLVDLVVEAGTAGGEKKTRKFTLYSGPRGG